MNATKDVNDCIAGAGRESNQDRTLRVSQVLLEWWLQFTACESIGAQNHESEEDKMDLRLAVGM